MTNTLIEKLPGLTDGDLTSLRNNATRLGETGTKKQKDAAAELLPAIEEETAARAQAKLAKAAAAKAARPKTRKKVAAKAVVAEDAEA
jgi:hypothetical protein